MSRTLIKPPLYVMSISFAAVLLCPFFAPADSITFSGKTYENVYVREGGTMYFVQIPAEGRVISVAKSDVSADAVRTSANPEERKALLEEWNRNNDKVRGISAPVTAEPATPPPAPNPTPSLTLKAAVDDAKATQGGSDTGYGPLVSIHMKDVPLGDALKVMLRSHNLDYAVEDGYIWISTPENIRREASGPLETEAFALQNVNDTLPKIVLNNPSSGLAYSTEGNAYGGQYGASTTGRGGYGGRAGAGYGGYGGQGTMGGRGYGGAGGMYGGGGGMGVPMMTGAHFSNVSDLFTTIDDRLVGETPAVIGVQAPTQRR